MLKKPEIALAFKILLLFTFVFALAFFILKGLYLYLWILIPITSYIVFDIYSMLKKAQDEVKEFVESIHYRDFSRCFNVQQAPTELQPLRKGFNEINSTFRLISKEKETQHQYLQQILELVDTGIISYEIKSGELNWMNEAFKKMLGIPYLKTIHSLEKRDKELYNALIDLKFKENKTVTITTDRGATNRVSTKILLTATGFQSNENIYKLVAFQNINSVIDETETQAWRKLLSVMTHEIMNSIAPIYSLADTLKKNLHAGMYDKDSMPLNYAEDLELGIETIKKRSEGLLKFAETYRRLNKITTLDVTTVLLCDIFENIYLLMHPTLKQKNITLEIFLDDPHLQMTADINLVDQMLINLIVNSIDALKEKKEGKIHLSGTMNATQKIMIKVADNGIGMTQEVQEKIFIPFFSTRKNGNGIGLSLCKQIMLLHKGSIQVQSKEHEGSIFILVFG